MTETVLPPKNGHTKDRQPNGSVQQMAEPLKIEQSLGGMVNASVTMAEQTFNGEVEVGPSKVALGHLTNAIAATKTQATVLSKIDKSKSPAIQRMLAKLLGAEMSNQLALEAPKEEKEPEPPAQSEDSAGIQ